MGSRLTRDNTPNRRDFLRFAGGLIGGVGGAVLAPAAPYPALAGRSKVVIGRDPQLRKSGSSLDSDHLLKLLDRVMQAAFDRDNPLEAWRQVVRPGEVVGLKVNCLAGKGISTNVPLVEAVCERLQQAGIKDIVIWDRLNSDLESARFRVNERGGPIRCFGNDTLGYEQELSTYGSVGSLLARTLTQVCDAVISLPVLKDHGIAGVTMALKNVFGAIHNPNKYHLDVGNPYIADVKHAGAHPLQVSPAHLRRHHGAVRGRPLIHAAMDVAV